MRVTVTLGLDYRVGWSPDECGGLPDGFGGVLSADEEGLLAREARDSAAADYWEAFDAVLPDWLGSVVINATSEVTMVSIGVPHPGSAGPEQTRATVHSDSPSGDSPRDAPDKAPGDDPDDDPDEVDFDRISAEVCTIVDNADLSPAVDEGMRIAAETALWIRADLPYEVGGDLFELLGATLADWQALPEPERPTPVLLGWMYRAGVTWAEWLATRPDEATLQSLAALRATTAH